MKCAFCGAELPDSSNFCPKCGSQVAGGRISIDTCKVVFTEIDSKWSLFGKFYYRFQALRENGDIVMESDKLELSGFEYNGPKEKVKKHKTVFDKFVKKMKDAGWHESAEIPKEWYAVTFEVTPKS